MRVLLVEDNAGFASAFERAIQTVPECELVWERSRDSALARLGAEPYDLVVLDRRIPSADGVLDDHQDHGWRVFQFVRGNRSGTSLWFLTGTEDADFATVMNNEYGRNEDILGRDVREQMYRVFWKKKAFLTALVKSGCFPPIVPNWTVLQFALTMTVWNWLRKSSVY